MRFFKKLRKVYASILVIPGLLETLIEGQEAIANMPEDILNSLKEVHSFQGILKDEIRHGYKVSVDSAEKVNLTLEILADNFQHQADGFKAMADYFKKENEITAIAKEESKKHEPSAHDLIF